MCFGENKGFTLHNLYGKQKYQVTELAQRAQLLHLFQVLLNKFAMNENHRETPE